MAATVYTNAVVITMDPERPRAGAVRVADGVVTDVLPSDPGPHLDGHRVDLGGATVLPGLVDAHLHLWGMGMAARELDLSGTSSPEEVVARVAGRAAVTPPGAWIRGRGWDQNRWPVQTFPSGAALDAATAEHPVWLVRIDGHVAWLNGAALRAVGVGPATVAPEGGEIPRDASGAPTGLLIDRAIELASGRLPEPSPDELRADLLRAMSLLREAGVTAVHDMGTTAATLAMLRRLEAEGLLTVRVWAYLDGSAPDLEARLAEPPDRGSAMGTLVRVVGVKIYADGALGSHGALLLAPYADRSDTRGLALTSPAELRRLSALAHRAGYQVAIHAIGDAGVRRTLDALEAVGGFGPHRVEHAQVVAPEDLPRFAALGAVASMQPTHATSDMSWVESRLGPDRMRGAYAWRTLLRSGAVVAFGSDAPVEPCDPWLGIHAAVTRQDARGLPREGFYPEERLGVEEALAAFTTSAHRALGIGGGSIRPGLPADLVVVAADPTAVPPAALRSMPVLRTVVGGREVWAAPTAP